MNWFQWSYLMPQRVLVQQSLLQTPQLVQIFRLSLVKQWFYPDENNGEVLCEMEPTCERSEIESNV